MKFKSIFQKIVVLMVSIVCLLGVAILGIIGSMFSGTYELQIYENNDQTADSVADSVSSFMNMAYRITEQLAYMEPIQSMDTDTQTPILEGTVERNNYFELLYIQDLNGDQTGRSSGELGNRANRWWFIQMQQLWKPFVSKSYYSVNTNMACASIFTPLQRDGKNIGILAADIKLDELQEAVAKFSDVNAGKISYIIDGEGVVVAHPESVYYEELYNYKNMTRTVPKTDSKGKVLYDADNNIVTEDMPIEISADYQNMIQNVMAGQSGRGQITDQGKEYYISYEPIAMDGSSDSWSVVTLQEKSSAMALMNRLIRAGIVATAIAVILAIILILLLSRNITRPVQYCLERLTALSHGDLSTEVPVSRGADESAQLLAALGRTIQALRRIINDISHQLNQIAAGDLTGKSEHSYDGEFNEISKSLHKINQSLNISIRQVENNSQRVLDGANSISGTAQSVANDAAIQASAVEELSASVHDASENSRDSADQAQGAREKMEAVSSDMARGTQSMADLMAAMNLISEDSKRISGISKTIQDISFQTNLLSMNASVEAVRAGQAGEGFAVIAREIRELAGHCAAASSDTTELVEANLTKVEQGMSALQTAVRAIEGSAAGTEEVRELIGMISDSASMQMESMKQISVSLEQISDVVQNNSTAARESAASSVEMRENALRLQKTIQVYRCE